MAKARIIKRTGPSGRVQYIIQQKHGLFWWWWIDAWLNSLSAAACRDNFDTLDEAKKNLCYFDGTKSKEEVVF